MSEILIPLVALLIGIASGLLLRKSPPKLDHSLCESILDHAQYDATAALVEMERKYKQQTKDSESIFVLKLQAIQNDFLEEKARYEKTAFLITPEIAELTEAAKTLAQSVNDIDASGEAKRHQVYSRLIKDFPEASRNDIALAIEFAVRSL